MWSRNWTSPWMVPTCRCSRWRNSRIAWRRSGWCSVRSACRLVSEMATSWGKWLARSCYLDHWLLWASGLCRWRLLRRCHVVSLVSTLSILSRHPLTFRICDVQSVVEIFGCWRLRLPAPPLLVAALKSSLVLSISCSLLQAWLRISLAKFLPLIPCLIFVLWFHELQSSLFCSFYPNLLPSREQWHFVALSCWSVRHYRMPVIVRGIESQLLPNLCGYLGLNQGLRSQQAVVKMRWQWIA